MYTDTENWSFAPVSCSIGTADGRFFYKHSGQVQILLQAQQEGTDSSTGTAETCRFSYRHSGDLQILLQAQRRLADSPTGTAETCRFF